MASSRKAHAPCHADADQPLLALHVTANMFGWPHIHWLLSKASGNFKAYKTAPANSSSACIAVPKLECAPWLHLLEGVQLVTSFPEGHHLLRMPVAPKPAHTLLP